MVVPSDVEACPGRNNEGCRKLNDPLGTNAVADRYGLHFRCCPGQSGSRYKDVLRVLENAWRRGHGKDDGNFRVEVAFDASGSPRVASSGFRPGDIAFRSGVNDKWTAIDYTHAPPHA